MSTEMDRARLKAGERRTKTSNEADFERAAETLLRAARPYLRSHPIKDALTVAMAIDRYFAQKGQGG